MGGLKDYNRGRNDGLALAEKIVRRGGLEELEKENRFRGVTGIHTSIAKKELEQASMAIKEMTLDTMLIMSVAVLHDEFGYGEKRCQRFIDRANRIAESLVDDMATWEDYREMIREEIGIEMVIRHSA